MLKKALFCFIFLKCICNQASVYTYPTIEASNGLAKVNKESVQCILKIAKQYIPCGNVITTISSGSFENIIEGLNGANCYTLITRSIQRQNWLMSTDVYLILLNSASELKLALREISRDLLWNPGMKFIFALDNVINDELIEIFNEILKHRIYNVVVLSIFHSQTFTYFPFANNSCGKKFTQIVNLHYCNNNSVVRNDVLFPNNDLKNYRGCSIVIGVKEAIPYAIISKKSNMKVSKEYNIGIEQQIMENIGRLEGIKIKYKIFYDNAFRGVVLPNNTATGILEYLQNNEISAVIGGYTLILNRITVFDYIWGYNYATIKIITRAATDKVWKKVYRTFSIQSWSLIVTSLFVMSITTFIILIVLSKKYEDPFNLFLKLLDYFLDHTNQKLFTNKNLKILLLLWIWYTYFINSFYKTAYYSLITGNIKEKRNYNWHNLSTFPYKPCVSEFGKSFFLHGYNLTVPNAKWIKECETIEGGLDYVAQRDDFYTFTTEYIYYQNAEKYIDEAGNFKLDSWEMLDATISTMYCTRGFPLKRRFQKHAMHIFESGIIKYHLNMMKVNKKHLTQNNNNFFKSMHLGDFVISYCILLVGSIISVLCFLFEKYFKNMM